jgi:NTP pyrophosphatase (non-canonical NTP hydrolase)
MKENIINWANERELLKPDNNFRQFTKLVEEVGELAAGIAKNDLIKIIDSIGDIQVVLIILAKQYQLDVDHCLEAAWHEIKERKGKTINGIFIKE